MPGVVVEGICVDFPVEPYRVQVEYMRSVVKCLQQGFNAVLESPTGTGKTLSLLCASLAWQETRKAQVQAMLQCRNESQLITQELNSKLANLTGIGWTTTIVPKIIYASRTHSQLAQVVAELKKTKYAYVKSAILGSRQQLCVHKDVVAESNASTKLHMCHAMVKGHQCVYYNNLENSTKEETLGGGILDIEELLAVGQKSKICPYYLARKLKTSADVVFMPYNYILDPKARKAQGIDLEGSVIIFDEAHNIEGNCEDAASGQLHSRDLAAAIEEVTSVMNDLQKEEEDDGGVLSGEQSVLSQFNIVELVSIKTRLLQVEKQIAAQSTTNEGTTLDGAFIFELFAAAEIQVDNVEKILELLDRIIEYLSFRSGALQRKGQALAKFLEFLDIVFRDDIPHGSLFHYASNYYRVHIQDVETKDAQRANSFFKTVNSKPGRILNYWCFSPALCMKALLANKVHSIIITSGTLSPLDTFMKELQIPVQISLENPHVIGQGQVWAGVVSRGPDGTSLNSSFDKRTDQFIDSLGRGILNFCRIIPDGVLVFFPSYSVMKKCRERWEFSGLWNKIGELKIPVVEPTGKEEFHSALKQFSDVIHDPSSARGAIFFAVFRGKVSEGLDFADRHGRAVIVAGIPFANVGEARIQNKRKYLNETNGKNLNRLNGQQWYFLQAIRAINQAVGRIIRHKNDYGAVLLCDERFSNPSTINSLSSWLKPQIKTFDNFGKVMKGLKTFFDNAEQTLPQPQEYKVPRKKVNISFEEEANFGKTTAFLPSKSIINNNNNNNNNNNDDVIKMNTNYSPEKPSTSNNVNLVSFYQKDDDEKDFDENYVPQLKLTKCLDALQEEGNANVSCLDIVQNRETATSTTSKSSLSSSKDEIVATKKYKKIVIKRKLEQYDEVENSPKKDKRQILKEIFVAAKTALRANEFDQLRTNLRSINLQNSQFDPLISTLARAFLNKPKVSHLFYEFRQTIPQHRQSEYDESVKKCIQTFTTNSNSK